MIEEDKFIGTFSGLALGDALGAPYEGGPIERFAWKLLGKTRDRKLRYTDDTQMAIDVARSYLEKYRIDQDHLAMTFAQSYRWSRGYGPSTGWLLKKIKKGGDFRKLNKSRYPKGSFGNGASMRAPILALCFPDKVKEIESSAMLCSEITHANPLAIECAKTIALTTNAALNNVETDVTLDSLPSWVQSESLQNKVRHCIALTKNPEHPNKNEIMNKLGNGIAASESVFTALYFSLRFREESFMGMLHEIAQIGGDADTIGAMAGAIWGAFNGYKRICEETDFSAIEDASIITDLGSSLHKRYVNE